MEEYMKACPTCRRMLHLVAIPQFDSHAYKDKRVTDLLTLYTSSHQSNGLAVRTVKTVKKLIGNSPGPYMAILSYRATTLSCTGTC